jgi:hypothetical protein
LLCRGNRTAERGWTGLQFGPEGPEFGRLYGMTKLPLNASLLPMWAPGVTDTATEMLKWQRARNFSKIHNMVDMACVCMTACLSLSWLQCRDIMVPADSSHDGGMVGVNRYDGAFFRADVADFCQAVNSSRPEWIFTVRPYPAL